MTAPRPPKDLYQCGQYGYGGTLVRGQRHHSLARKRPRRVDDGAGPGALVIVPYVLINAMNSAKPATPMDLRNQRSVLVVPIMVDRSDMRPWYGGSWLMSPFCGPLTSERGTMRAYLRL